MFQATRRRLALWYTTITAMFLLVFAGGFYSYVHNTLVERIDDTLKHVVEVVDRSIAAAEQPISLNQWLHYNESAEFPESTEPPESIGSLKSLAVTQDQLEEDHIDLEWFSPAGDLIRDTLSSHLGIPLNPHSHIETVYLNSGAGLRQITTPIQVGHQLLGYLRVSHPWFEVTKPIQQLSLDLTLGLILMVASAAAIGWFLSGLAMAPVRESYQRLKQFTADASHELRSPIASLQTNVQVALADPDLDPQTRQTWQILERTTQRLGRLVEDLLFLARQDHQPQPLRRISCPLDEILLEVIEEQEPLAQERNIDLHLEIEPNHPSFPQPSDSGSRSQEAGEDLFQVWGDPDQLIRLFTNLITNAIQYTPTGGNVQVELQRLAKPGIPQLQIQVKDTGIGIPAEAIPHVFDRFYRLDQARSHTCSAPHSQQDLSRSAVGSGLGLAIAQVIVSNHQGQIRVESHPGVGSTFSVMLPQAISI